MSSPHEDVQDVQTPSLTLPHHQLVYGVNPLLEWHNHSNPVCELRSPGGDDRGVQAVHDGALEDGDTKPLRYDHHQTVTEGAPDLLL